MIPEVLIAVVGSIASAAALTLIGYLWRRATIKRKLALQNLDRILGWYKYIDVNLDAPDYNSFEVESMEKEINHHFQTSLLRKYKLFFTDRFISRFLAHVRGFAGYSEHTRLEKCPFL